jgi:hypothetical protein
MAAGELRVNIVVRRRTSLLRLVDERNAYRNACVTQVYRWVPRTPPYTPRRAGQRHACGPVALGGRLLPASKIKWSRVVRGRP